MKNKIAEAAQLVLAKVRKKKYKKSFDEEWDSETHRTLKMRS